MTDRRQGAIQEIVFELALIAAKDQVDLWIQNRHTSRNRNLAFHCASGWGSRPDVVVTEGFKEIPTLDQCGLGLLPRSSSSVEGAPIGYRKGHSAAYDSGHSRSPKSDSNEKITRRDSNPERYPCPRERNSIWASACPRLRSNNKGEGRRVMDLVPLRSA